MNQIQNSYILYLYRSKAPNLTFVRLSGTSICFLRHLTAVNRQNSLTGDL